MNAYLNRVDGLDDAIISMYLSKRSIDRKLENEIRRDVMVAERDVWIGETARGAILRKEFLPDQLVGRLEKLFKWGTIHPTMLRFIDLSFSVYGLHRAGQDDTDSHAYRYQNRIIRSSTRLADFQSGEMSDYYKGKIIPTDLALLALGIETPDEITVDGKTYVKSVNGYIIKGMENNRDVKRGLLMLSIPSNFIFRINLTDFAHVYAERRAQGTANPEVKEAFESMMDQLENATAGFVTRELLLKIERLDK